MLPPRYQHQVIGFLQSSAKPPRVAVRARGTVLSLDNVVDLIARLRVGDGALQFRKAPRAVEVRSDLRPIFGDPCCRFNRREHDLDAAVGSAGGAERGGPAQPLRSTPDDAVALLRCRRRFRGDFWRLGVAAAPAGPLSAVGVAGGDARLVRIEAGLA